MAMFPYHPQPSGAGTGDALVANPLSQFASTSSAQLKTVINNETGSGSLVFGTSPTINTPLLVTPELGAATSVSFPVYADEAAAVTGGLATGKLYQTAAGALRIKL